MPRAVALAFATASTTRRARSSSGVGAASNERTFVAGWVQCKPLVLRWSYCYLPPQPEGETWPIARRDGSRNCPLERGTAMSARAATATQATQKAPRELEDLQLVVRTRNGDTAALDVLIRRYTGFVRLKASSYFLAGGDSEDLVQEGLIGLYKAVRDFRPDKETSFRSFAELCVTRQIITAIKTATRFKHAPLNTYVSFSHTPAGQESDGDCTLGDALPGPSVNDPSICVISTEELQSLVFCLGTGLSQLESNALRLYLEGSSYEEMAAELGCDTKTIDNALQRVKRKVLTHQRSRQVLQ
ncbi:MAG TPA: RNA polymerase sporulation sigma factor SigH [Gaiellaceae bacterium]